MALVKAIRQTVKEIIDLGSKSPILADPKSRIFCKQYYDLKKATADAGEGEQQASTGEQLHHSTQQLFKSICKDYGFRTEQLYTTINSISKLNKTQQEFSQNFKPSTFDKLTKSLKPEYYNLFQSLARVQEGVKTLVNMREDLLNVLEKNKKFINNNDQELENLKIMNTILKDLLTLCFATSMLNIERITWNSPASLVEKVAQFESVHRMKSLSELKIRLSANRRCFIYTHSTMPYEPLVILHIALTNSISCNISTLIKDAIAEKHQLKLANEVPPSNAIFYSINSCQKGLQQVDLGNALIKSCVHLLLEEVPSLKFFHSLSPIPQFRDWLDMKLAEAEEKTLEPSSTAYNFKEAFDEHELTFLANYFKIKQDQTRSDQELVSKIKAFLASKQFQTTAADQVVPMDIDDTDSVDHIMARFLLRSCAFYLAHEKKNGYAYNSVCNFHLRNGAQIFRINYAANTSDKGWRASYGLMVNYGYYLDDLESNCINYLTQKKIKTSENVNELLRYFRRPVVTGTTAGNDDAPQSKL